MAQASLELHRRVSKDCVVVLDVDDGYLHRFRLGLDTTQVEESSSDGTPAERKGWRICVHICRQ